MYIFSTPLYKIELKKNTTALIVLDLVAYYPQNGTPYFFRVNACFSRDLSDAFRVGNEDILAFGLNCNSNSIFIEYRIEYKFVYISVRNIHKTEWHSTISISSPRGKCILH